MSRKHASQSASVVERMARFMEERAALRGSCTADDLAEEFTSTEIVEYHAEAADIAKARRIRKVA